MGNIRDILKCTIFIESGAYQVLKTIVAFLSVDMNADRIKLNLNNSFLTKKRSVEIHVMNEWHIKNRQGMYI